jgi:hypothetical protein
MEMDVTIVGTGKVGTALARRFAASGHSVTLVGRTREKAEEAAAEIEGAQAADTVEGGDVVVLAVYWRDAQAAVEEYRDALAGRVLVETTNPMTDDYSAVLELEAGSGTAELAKLVGDDTPVVKAFNTTFANTLADGEAGGQPLDVFVAGDDDGAKAKVGELVESSGMRPVDAGGLANARHLESVGFVHISAQGALDTGFASALKIVA